MSCTGVRVYFNSVLVIINLTCIYWLPAMHHAQTTKLTTFMYGCMCVYWLTYWSLSGLHMVFHFSYQWYVTRQRGKCPRILKFQGLNNYRNANRSLAKGSETINDPGREVTASWGCDRFCFCYQLGRVHQVGDAIQPSHPLSSPSPPAPNPSQHQSFPMSQLIGPHRYDLN